MPYTRMVKLIVVNRRDAGLYLVPNISDGAFFQCGLYSSVAYTPVYQVSRTVFYYDADDFSNIVDIADFCSNRENNGKFLGGQIHHSYIIHTSFLHHPYIIHASSTHHPRIIHTSFIHHSYITMHHHASTIYKYYSCTLTSVLHVLCRYMPQKHTLHWLSLEKESWTSQWVFA